MLLRLITIIVTIIVIFVFVFVFVFFDRLAKSMALKKVKIEI